MNRHPPPATVLPSPVTPESFGMCKNSTVTKILLFFKLMMRLGVLIWITLVTDTQLRPRYQSYLTELEFRGDAKLATFSYNSLIRSLNDIRLADCLCSKFAV
jgi:hypothetical protein